MKRLTLFLIATFLATGSLLAQQAHDFRFEISAETGLVSVLSGPDLESISNAVVRFGFAPSKHFLLTLTFTKLEGELATDDILNEQFQVTYNDENSPDLKFRNAFLDDRTVDIKQYELGIVKEIPFGNKHWEGFVGVGVGLADSTADISWVGATEQNGDPASPTLSVEENNEFLTSVRAGARYLPVPWFAVQLNVKIVPIATLFDEDINTLEVNGGVLFRFGKF